MYSCPMHPEIQKDKPGTCPKCGMDLQGEKGGQKEGRELLHKFWVSLILTLPVFILAMGHLWNWKPFQKEISLLVQASLATPVVLWGGFPFFKRAYEGMLAKSINMFTLISIGIGVAYGYSVYVIANHIAEEVYFEAAAVITTLVLLGQVIETRGRNRTSDAIRSLIDLAPKKAHKIIEGKEEEIDLDQVVLGDLLRVRPGEKIPVDGKVEEGESQIDTSMVTGEMAPIHVRLGNKVVGGTINLTSTFAMRAEKVGSETLLNQIVELVKSAQQSRSPMQKMADRASSFFVPIVVLVAVITWIVWALIASFERGLINAVSVLIVSCPCALGLATPLSITVGIGRGAKEGILIKDAEALEAMCKVDTLVIDKTGTLTEGKIEAFCEDQEAISYGASLAHLSEHPISQAIAKLEKEHWPVTHFLSHAGKGIEGEIHGKKVVLGSKRLVEDAPEEEGVYLSVDGKYRATFTIRDPLKKSTPEAIQKLHQEGLKLVMATGDQKKNALRIAKELAIDQVEAEVLPTEKHKVVEKYQKDKKIVAMAGDGVNDAPALAKANVGIAMGTGTEIAMQSAQVTLVKGDLLGIAKARYLSEKTVRNIRQNLFFAFVYNIVAVPIAAGVLAPVGIFLNPMIASAAMTISSISVVFNALRLNRVFPSASSKERQSAPCCE